MKIAKYISGTVLTATCLTAYVTAKLYEANNIEFGQALKIIIICLIFFGISFRVFAKVSKGECEYGKNSYLSNL